MCTSCTPSKCAAPGCLLLWHFQCNPVLPYATGTPYRPSGCRTQTGLFNVRGTFTLQAPNTMSHSRTKGRGLHIHMAAALTMATVERRYETQNVAFVSVTYLTRARECAVIRDHVPKSGWFTLNPCPSQSTVSARVPSSGARRFL